MMLTTLIVMMMTIVVSQADTVMPFDQFVLTACNPYFVYTSYNEVYSVHNLSVAGPPSTTSLWGPLVSELPAYLECSPNDGVRVADSYVSSSNTTEPPFPFLESARSLQQVVMADNGNFKEHGGFSISLWFTPSSAVPTTDAAEPEPILTIGLPYPIQATSAVEAVDGCLGYDLMIAQYQNHLYLAYRDNDPAHSCRQLLLQNIDLTTPLTSSSSSATPMNIVMDWNTSSDETNVYLDGKGVVLGAPNNFDLSSWDPHDMVQLFRNANSGSAVFRGAIYQVSFFDQALDADSVAEIYRQGVVIVEEGPISLDAPLALTNLSLAQDDSTPVSFSLMTSTNESTTSSGALQLLLEVTSLPIHGVLRLTGSNSTALTVNTQLVIAQDAVALEYMLPPDSYNYFNMPDVTANGVSLGFEPDRFSFRVIAKDTRTLNVVGTSSMVSQIVNLIHVNHKPTLVAPEQVISNQQQQQDPSNTYDNGFNIDGIVVSDPDLDMERVRVDVSSNAGYLTLNAQYRNLAIGGSVFAACSHRTYSPWQCVAPNGGVRERHMTFVAVPDDVNLILQGIFYESIVKGMADEITVSIYDGAGGDCLSNNEQPTVFDAFGNRFATINRECWKVTATIQVPAFKVNAQDGQNAGSHGRRHIQRADLIFWTLLFVATVAVCTWMYKQCARCLIRRIRPIEVFNEDDHNEEEATIASISTKTSDIEGNKSSADVEAAVEEYSATQEERHDQDDEQSFHAAEETSYPV